MNYNEKVKEAKERSIELENLIEEQMHMKELRKEYEETVIKFMIHQYKEFGNLEVFKSEDEEKREKSKDVLKTLIRIALAKVIGNENLDIHLNTIMNGIYEKES